MTYVEPDKLDRLFGIQARFQHRMGCNLRAMPDEMRVQYIKDMVLAATEELHEALGEVNWKPWASARPGFKDIDRYTGELVDVTCFLLNLMLAAGITSDQLMTAYEAKMQVNEDRQDRGYSGHDKCDNPGCRRALDEPGKASGIIVTPLGFRYCSPACAREAGDEA